MASVGALSPSKANSSRVIPSYLGLERDADAATDGCGLCELVDLRGLEEEEEEPDACADEEGRDAERSGSDRMSRTSLDVMVTQPDRVLGDYASEREVFGTCA